MLEEMLHLFAVEYDVSCGLVKYGLYYVEVCPLYVHFLKFLIINVCGFYWMPFFASVELIIWYFFPSTCWFHASHWFVGLNLLSLFGVNPPLSWCAILLMCYWSSVCLYLVEDFCTCILQWCWPIIFFLWYLFLVLVSGCC